MVWILIVTVKTRPRKPNNQVPRRKTIKDRSRDVQTILLLEMPRTSHYQYVYTTATPKIGAGIALMALLGLTACGDEDKDTSGDTAMVPDTSDMALYGVPFTDNDNDGWAQEDGDCDDDNPEVNPDADETPGDGVDSEDCNGDQRRYLNLISE